MRFGSLPVKRPQYVAGIRSGRGQNPLELQRGDHVGEASIAKVLLQPRIEDLVAGSEDDRADLQLDLLFPLQVVDRVRLAGGLAEMAIGADPAGETTFGLGNGFFRRVADMDLGKRSSTCRGVEGLHWYLALHQHAVRVHFVFGVIRPFQLASDAQVLVIEPAIDRDCSLLAGEFGIHHHVGTGDTIATRKHSGQPGFERQRVGCERSPLCGLQTQAFS